MQTFRRVFSYALGLGIVGLTIFALWNRQNIYDWYRLRGYTPPAEVEALAEHTKMTDLGKKLFYVHKPRLEDRDTFNASCTHTEQTIVLGCYISHQSIHIFDVSDERLQGIREVTAAHEMLHAAYDRLDESEKLRLDKLLVSYYDKIKKDHPRLKKIITAYYERDVQVVGTELHSILGSELRELTPELEAHYSQYFTDRLSVVAYAEQYEDVFLEQQQRIDSLSESIQQLEQELKERKEAIQTEEQSLQQESERLTALRTQNDISTYNAAVPDYNRQVNSYRSAVASFNNDIQRLNDLIKEYNNLAVQQKELYDAIDSREPDA